LDSKVVDFYGIRENYLAVTFVYPEFQNYGTGKTIGSSYKIAFNLNFIGVQGK